MTCISFNQHRFQKPQKMQVFRTQTIQRFMTGQKRSMSYFRRVSFPTENPYPLSWIAGALILGVTYLQDVSEFRTRNPKDLIHQARSDAFGVQRVVKAMREMNLSLVMHNGDPDDSFFNAAPALIHGQVIQRAIYPNLSSNSSLVVREAASLLKRLIEQPKSNSYIDRTVLAKILEGIAKWKEHPDVLLPLTQSLHEYVKKHPKEIDVEKLCPIVNEITAIAVEALDANNVESVTSVTKSSNSSYSFSYEVRLGSHSEEKENKQVNVSPRAINEFLVHSAGELCETLSYHYPDHSFDLIPAFIALHEHENRYFEDIFGEDAYLGSDTVYLAIRIHQRLQSHPTRPDNIPEATWNKMMNLQEHIKIFADDSWVKFNMFLDHHEAIRDPLTLITSSMSFGFLWGAIRTWVKLRHVHPSSMSLEMPRAGFPSENISMAQAGSWRRAMALKFGIRAAVGSTLGVAFLEVCTLASKYLWIESRQVQTGLSFVKITSTIALWLGILRNCPYSLVPYIIATNSDRYSDFQELAELL